MIYRIMHVECDADNCDVELEMSGTLGFDDVVVLLEAYGWLVVPVPIGLSSYYTMCPEHSAEYGVDDATINIKPTG